VSATAKEKVDDLLKEWIAPWMKEREFRRTRGTFRRERDGAWQIANFQRSQYSDASNVPFIVSLGVGFAALHEDDPEWARRGWPLEPECDFRQRVGVLVEGEDHRWKVTPSTLTEPLAGEILERMDTVGLPWLDLHSSPEEYLAHAVADPAGVKALNLNAFVALAKRFGDADQVEVAERELSRWHRDMR
jgi:hypothetical protein